jgi:pyruvate/2-oxoglutarate dehydrogenase complex dihydrolipoamide acyltransferase (E2) component
VILDSQTEILSPLEGTVAYVDVGEGSRVEEGALILYIDPKPNPEQLKVFAFFPISRSSQIQKEMKAFFSIHLVDRERYGELVGQVKRILPYPVGPDDVFLQKIPSEVLRKYLVAGDEPCNLVVIAPLPSASTPSGLTWTSSEGPPFPLHPGLIGNVRIILDEVSPLEFVIPRRP